MQVAAGGTKKLGPLYCGPFIVLEKYTAAYKLKLPPHMKIHPTFHVSQLKLYKKANERGQNLPEARPNFDSYRGRRIRGRGNHQPWNEASW